MPHPNTDPNRLEARIVRYRDLRPCFDAFIDTRTPGSDSKENFTIIGPGVSENPNQYVHIAEPHGFNIGGARQPPGCTNSQHSHDTVEVFFVHSGTWSFNLGEDGEDAKITLRAGDLISIPTQIFRGFENIGDDVGYLWAVLGKDNPGRVLWAPKVFEMAKEYGLVLLENGTLIDTAKGEIIPAGAAQMPMTSAQQIESLHRFGDADLRRCCVLNSDIMPKRLSDGVAQRDLIGADTPLNWEHGFLLSHIKIDRGCEMTDTERQAADVIFVHVGELTVRVDDTECRLMAGDTMTIPKGATRVFRQSGDCDVEFLRVLGDA